MTPDHDVLLESFVYEPRLNRVQEAVISSHFMYQLAKNIDLLPYNEEEFAAKSLSIDSGIVDTVLLPCLLSACRDFFRHRAETARPRARQNYQKYGLASAHEIESAHVITEVMFDRQYLRGPRDTCSREVLCCKVKERLRAGAPIEMVIPALPFKFSSPIKSRGPLPDLGEVNFILALYEIAATIELIYREARPDLRGQLAVFTVVSDGSRFNRLVGEMDSTLESYRANLNTWIDRLGLGGYVRIHDYRALLISRLAPPILEAKAAIANMARLDYAREMWPIFDPCEIAETIRLAAQVEPDPESANPEGRFVTLLKSLIFTVNYKTLRNLKCLPERDERGLYRELTGHIFEPYVILSPDELRDTAEILDTGADISLTDRTKEYLRQSMLREAWTATIDYMAEIKSDRELEEDPILTCLPGYFRWTIHGKPGQLALLTATAMGTPIQGWAGAAVFRLTKKNKIKLCTLPILALEGRGAIPVRVRDLEDAATSAPQPLFYLDPEITFSDLNEFLSTLRQSLVRDRAS